MYLYIFFLNLNMVDGITIGERDTELSKLLSREKEIIRISRRDPLTLKLQSQISGKVGRGNVGLEFKRITKSKKRIGLRDLTQVKKERKSLLGIPIIGEPAPIVDIPQIDLELDF